MASSRKLDSRLVALSACPLGLIRLPVGTFRPPQKYGDCRLAISSSQSPCRYSAPWVSPRKTSTPLTEPSLTRSSQGTLWRRCPGDPLAAVGKIQLPRSNPDRARGKRLSHHGKSSFSGGAGGARWISQTAAGGSVAGRRRRGSSRLDRTAGPERATLIRGQLAPSRSDASSCRLVGLSLCRLDGLPSLSDTD